VHEAPGVARIGLHLHAARDRDQARRDHLARHAEMVQEPSEFVARRPGLVAGAELDPILEVRDEAADARLVVKEPIDDRHIASGLEHRRGDRVLVDVEAYKMRSPEADFLMDTVGSFRMWLGQNVWATHVTCVPSRPFYCH